MFLAWLITRDNNDIDEVEGCQVSLAQAWKFGAQYDMPDFQDAIMDRLIYYFSWDELSPSAVFEAYAGTERGTKLQRAFIAQLTIVMRSEREHAWPRNYFTDLRLERVPDFLLDLTDAMREADSDSHLEINYFLYKHKDNTE